MEKYELESRLIDVSEFKGDHTAENLKNDFAKNVETYGLDNVLTVTDSGSNIKKAMRLYGGNWMSCFGHDNNLIFIFGYNRSPEIIQLRIKLGKLVTVTKRSNTAKRFLKECEIAVGILIFMPLLQMTETRWNR